MQDTLLRERNQITLPGDVVEAAGLVPKRDRIVWRYEGGEVRGRKLTSPPYRDGEITRDPANGLLFWQGDISDDEAEAAALSANLDRQ